MTEMPLNIWACPRGSGAISGVWTDGRCADEPETQYTNTAQLRERIEGMIAPQVNGTYSPSRAAHNAALKQVLEMLDA